MSTEVDLINHLDEMNSVVSEYLKGSDPTKIAKDLSIARVRVVAHLDEEQATDTLRSKSWIRIRITGER